MDHTIFTGQRIWCPLCTDHRTFLRIPNAARLLEGSDHQARLNPAALAKRLVPRASGTLRLRRRPLHDPVGTGSRF